MDNISTARVLVIGATGGLGGALTEAFHRTGASVIGVAGPGHTRDGCDITTAYGREQIVSLAANGGIDIAVIASGAVGFAPLSATSPDDIERLVTVNLTGPLALIGLLEPHIRTGGCIVALTGAVVDVPTVGMAAYTAAKSGLSGALRVVRRELRARRINVIDARPPHTETGLATRPLYGSAPRLPQGLDPQAVADRIVKAVAAGETELPPDAFNATAD